MAGEFIASGADEDAFFGRVERTLRSYVDRFKFLEDLPLDGFGLTPLGRTMLGAPGNPYELAAYLGEPHCPADSPATPLYGTLFAPFANQMLIPAREQPLRNP